MSEADSNKPTICTSPEVQPRRGGWANSPSTLEPNSGRTRTAIGIVKALLKPDYTLGGASGSSLPITHFLLLKASGSSLPITHFLLLIVEDPVRCIKMSNG